MKIDEALYQIQQRIKMHELEQTTSVENEREKVILNYINKLQKQLDFMIDRNDEKQDRINKARIYIKEHSTTIDYKTMKADYNLNMNDLLDILKGDNK